MPPNEDQLDEEQVKEIAVQLIRDMRYNMKLDGDEFIRRSKLPRPN